MLQLSHLSLTGTVLVADDHAPNREFLEELLVAEGLKVISVPDGAVAVRTWPYSSRPGATGCHDASPQWV